MSGRYPTERERHMLAGRILPHDVPCVRERRAGLAADGTPREIDFVVPFERSHHEWTLHLEAAGVVKRPWLNTPTLRIAPEVS